MVHLVRHAVHDRVGSTLVGRMAEVRLGAEGRAQAERLATRLANEGVVVVQSSPRERALETAAPIAAQLGSEVEIAEGLDEIDFGAWTGRRFAELDGDPAWAAWNAERATAPTPGGETMAEAQARITGHIAALRARLGARAAVLVSHADMIKAAVAHILGLPLGAIHRFEIAPASITTLRLDEGGGTLVRLNEAV